jgi:hypothetical protein
MVNVIFLNYAGWIELGVFCYCVVSVSVVVFSMGVSVVQCTSRAESLSQG